MTARRVLVTGAAGFVGRHLCHYLETAGSNLHVTSTDVVAKPDASCAEYAAGDLSAGDVAAELITQVKPDCVVHLAGIFGSANVPEMYRANVLGLVALLEAVRRHAPGAAVATAGSAAEYGRVPEEGLPVRETCPCEPVTDYGQSKLAATHIGLYYQRVHGVAVTIFRPFQLLGRGVTARLAPGAFAEQLRHATQSGSRVVRVGNLESARDFLDVRDAVAGIWALCLKPAPGEVFNLCSGRPTKMADLLHTMIRVSQAEVTLEVDPGRLRGQADVAKVYGSHEKLTHHCGWRPRFDLEESVRAMVG